MSYDYSFGNGLGWGALATISVIMILLAIGIVVLFYVFESLGLYAIAKRRGVASPGLAWVPVANYWIMGCIADQYDEYTTAKSMNLKNILLWLSIGSVLAGLIPFIGWLVGVALLVFMYMALYRIYKSCSPDNAVLLLVLSIIFSVITPFVLFALRNKDEGMIPPQQSGPNGQYNAYGNGGQYQGGAQTGGYNNPGQSQYEAYQNPGQQTYNGQSANQAGQPGYGNPNPSESQDYGQYPGQDGQN